MHAEVDISGRIEETNRPSALALTNDVSICVLISAREKRIALEGLRRKRPDRDATAHNITIYATLIFFALRNYHSELYEVVIDLEYTGYEANIKLLILSLCKRNGITLRTQVSFFAVGKKSPAHNLAISVFRGERAADHLIKAEDILEQV